jgi:hypothetical protein
VVASRGVTERRAGRLVTPYSPKCVELEFSEVRHFLGALMCFVPWRTYIPLIQEYAAFVTWQVDAA